MTDRSGERFGRWLILKFYERRGKSYFYQAECDCGNVKIISISLLVSGGSKSCGCYAREMAVISGKANMRHGQSIGNGTREYRCWCRLKTVCFNSNHDNYKYYGGRGITMADRWVNSFENFLEDMGKCPDGYTIERINTDGNYEPSNCKWLLSELQPKNTTRNRWYEYNGKRLIVADWIRELKIRKHVFYNAIKTSTFEQIIAKYST